MAARIYALAKELKLDSKVLVDLCPKAGIHGKGSALASMTDEEVAKLRAYLSSLSSRSPTKAASAAATKSAPIPVIRSKGATPGDAVEAPHAETSPAETSPVESPAPTEAPAPAAQTPAPE